MGEERSAGVSGEGKGEAFAEWTPVQPDAVLAGTLSVTVWMTLRDQTLVRQVYAVSATWAHVAERHEAQFSLELGRELVPQVLNAPELVYRAAKPGSVMFVGNYDAMHYLVVPVKLLSNEIWVESMYLDRRDRLAVRLQKREVIYRRVDTG